MYYIRWFDDEYIYIYMMYFIRWFGDEYIYIYI